MARTTLLLCLLVAILGATLLSVGAEDATQQCAADDDTCRAKAAGEATKTVKVPKIAREDGAAPEVKVGVCNDRHDSCPKFASTGECTKNPGWMIVNCPKSCDSCEMLDPKVRCDRARLNMTLTPAYAAGQMEAMFSSIPDRFKDKYGVEVHSTKPWVVTFDNFLTDDEINALLETVEGNWERCEEHPQVRSVVEKIEEVTGVPYVNYESFQILHYDVGQHYRTHHDMSERQVSLACGPRILTFFLYLSDVEEGGETSFPSLKLSVTPKKGKALLWPSTLDEDQEKKDSRTNHEAKPVISGVKYAANSWIHLYDFKTPNLWGE